MPASYDAEAVAGYFDEFGEGEWERGARILVTDVSPVQLRLNESAGLGDGVEERRILDVVDMSALPDESFDAVVCYGGPLSYAMDRRSEAARECARVARSGAPLLFGVTSLWGSVHRGLTFVLSVPREANEAELLLREGLELRTMSAATALTTGWSDRLAEVRADPERWTELLNMEIRACAEPGCVECGPHIIAVCTKPRSSTPEGIDG